jgi:hypothetical protein
VPTTVEDQAQGNAKRAFWWLAFLLSIFWWWWASQGDRTRLVMLAAVSMASFAIGCLAGFLFTSYGEESNTVGKIRDWLIGGISGLTFAQVIDKDSSLKHMFAAFAVKEGPNDYALVVASAVIFSVLGFFFMFLQRELLLNVELAQSRAVRVRLEETKQAGQVIQRLLIQLPPSLLSGVDDINQIVQVNKTIADALRAVLFAKEVDSFLEETENSLRDGSAMDWDILFRTAHLHYYRIYFEKDDRRDSEIKSASEWILRALTVNPKHVDLTMKYADVLHMANNNGEAVAVLERLVTWPEAPVIAKQWLGSFMLRLPDKMDKSIEYSETYMKEFPQDNDALLNIVRAYAQKYCSELRAKRKAAELGSANRAKTLELLAELLRRRARYADTVKAGMVKGKFFECLASDPQFCELVGVKPSPTTPPAEAAPTLSSPESKDNNLQRAPAETPPKD